MNTLFYHNARNWINQSQVDLNNKKYLSSWAKTIPARLNYLADAVANYVLAIFNFLKVCFEGIRLIYTWGKESRNFEMVLKDMNKNVNHVISDLAGIFFINSGKYLRDKENFLMFFAIVSVVATLRVLYLKI